MQESYSFLTSLLHVFLLFFRQLIGIIYKKEECIMAGFTCPYCGMVMVIEANTHSERFPSFNRDKGDTWSPQYGRNLDSSTVKMDFYKCPNCESITIIAKGSGDAVSDVDTIIRPRSNAKQYPDYIPAQIRSDYEEACAVLFLSPKSSATLARRCLQGMIRDYWGIVKSRLYDEITALKDMVQPDLWQAIDNLRQLGNIGAHMEKDTDVIVDIDPGEAEKLIKLIELLMKEWYINREERNKLFGDIFQINADKQATRKGEG